MVYKCAWCVRTGKAKSNIIPCHRCKELVCGGCTYFYVDGNNIAITRSSHKYCIECYIYTHADRDRWYIDSFEKKKLDWIENNGE